MILHHLRADVRYALKWLARSPGFTAIAVASLGIGIGFNATVFSVLDALLLRPLTIERPNRIVDVYTRGSDGDTYATSSYPDYLDFRSQNDVFTDVLAYSPALAAVKTGDQSRMALGEVVTGNYFHVLGVSAAIGRTLLPEDDRPGAPRTVVLSDRLWRREYRADPSIVGRSVHIHGQPYTIVGVAPRTFTGMLPILQPEMWIPVAWTDEVEPAGISDSVPSPTGKTRFDRRGQRWLLVRGRLKDHETVTRAQANLQLIMQQLESAHPATNTNRPVSVAANVRVHPDADRALRPIALGLMLGVGLVLLVACGNVANMLLARASGRQREIGIRLAIGATRRRLIAQLVTEGMVLGLMGAVAGAGLATVLLRLIELPMPMPVPIRFELRLDIRVLFFTTVVALASGILAGLAPALRATRPNLTGDLKGEMSMMRAGRRRLTLRDTLVVGQTAFTVVLLVTAGLLTRSIVEAQRLDLGFQATGLAVVTTELSLVGYNDDRAKAVFDRAIERVRTLPGVMSASLASRQPLALNFNRQSVFLPDRQRAGDPAHSVASVWVDEPYFQTLGVPLLRGRTFTSADMTPSSRIAVVTDSFVRTYWPDAADPIGRRFRLRGIDGPEYEVVGVVGDYKVETIGERSRPYIHHPRGQRGSSGAVLIARTAASPDALVAAIKRELLDQEPNAVFIEAQTMNTQVDASLLPARLAAQTAALVGLVAMVLAAIGLYGVIAYAVARRTREIGIRMALGAAPGGVVSMVMRQGLSVACAGIGIGLLLTWPAARTLAAGLYGISAFDPLAWSAAIAVLLTAAVVANYVPARRAARVDPSAALRTE